jgi:hypothetical protein
MSFEAQPAVSFSTWSLSAIDPFMLHVVLPFPVAFLASRLFYGRARKAGRQSESFSPTVASILVTPLLAVAYYLLAALHYAGIAMLLVGLVLSAPIIVPLLPLLVIYLRGGFRRKRIFGVILSATSVVVVAVQFVAFYIFGLALGRD